MPPKLRPTRTWNYDSDSSLTSLDEESDDEQSIVEPPLTSSQRGQHAPPPPLKDDVLGLRPSSSRHGRATRQATQKAAEEDMGGITDRDQEVLPPYQTTPATVSMVYDWMAEGLVDICPDYQRDVVWSEAKQINLIDSIFHNFSVSNLIFARRYVDGEAQRVCIDGRQRLTSIKRFIEGEIPWKNPTTKKKYWFCKTQPNQRRTILSSKEQRMFKMKPIAADDYDNITKNQERMIFQRVQLGTVLTPAERLQAVNGVTATLVREVRKYVCALVVFDSFSEWGGNRGRDFLALAQIVHLIKFGKLPLTLPEPDKLTAFLEGKIGGDMNAVHERVRHSFTIFARLLSHPVYGTVLSEKEISPVEFVVAVYAISSLKATLTDSYLANALKQIWGYARERSTAKKKATKSSACQAYTDMRNFFERIRGDRRTVTLVGDPSERVKAADVPWDQDLAVVDAQPEEESEAPTPMEDVRKINSKKRTRQEIEANDAESDDDNIPLSKVKTERKAQVKKKAKRSRPAKREVVDPEDDAESDGSAPIVSCVPKRSATSGSTAKRPSQVGTRPATSAAATRVKRPPSTKREAPASTAAVPQPASAASTSAAATGPSRGACTKPGASRSSSVQSFSTARQGNTPGATSVPPSRLSQPRSANTTPSMGTAALPPDMSRNGGGGSNPNARMERLQNLKQISKPNSSSATPPLQFHPPLSSTSSAKLPTPPKDSPTPEDTRVVAHPRFPPGQVASTSASVQPPGPATGGADSVLDTFRAKGSNLTTLKFSKTPSEAKIEAPTPPLPSRVPAGLPKAGPVVGPTAGFGGPLNRPRPTGSAAVGPTYLHNFPANPNAFALRRTADPRVLPTPPTSANMPKDAMNR